MAQILDFNRPKSFKKRPESFRVRWLKADDYVKSGQLDKALDIFESLANDGYVEAYVEIGNILERGGNGVKQDFDAARRWYMKAIDEFGDDYAYVGLARLALQNYNDAGTPSDAVDYLLKACNDGNPIAMIMLGTLYHSGGVVPKDLLHAAQLYERAWGMGYVLPLAYLSKIKMEQGRYITGFWLRLKVAWSAFQIAKRDPADPRLWNYM